jgi:DNA-binding beta-propeller fold protein YncE
LRDSVVSNSYARSTAKSIGGGVATPGTLQIVYSTVTGNRAGGAPGAQGYGGGVFGSASTTIDNSTLDNNYAQTSGGAFALLKSGSRGSAVISNSTISGNIASERGGASYIENVNVGIYNSTVAFNTAGHFGSGRFGGLYVYGFSTLILQSSIFANNSDTSTSAHDLYINYSRSGAISSGSRNILARSTNVVTPAIIVSSADPKITPLANHGGLTRTHALLPGSPAIDMGNDGSSLTIDQRGNGFARVVGAGADIGAYERQADDDEIFYSGLESNAQQFSPSIIVLATGFKQPTGIAVDSQGNVFVADRQNNAVKEILASNGTTVTVGSGFSVPSGVAVDKHNNVFVADTINNAIKEIVAVNGTIPASPTIRTLSTSFNFPAGVAVDAAGNVFVADTSNSAVKELVAVNGSIPATPTIVTLGSGFNFPFGIAVDQNDNVYVADTVNGKIKELLKTGNYMTIDTIGTGFIRPYGVWVDATGNVFAADSTTNNVSEISADHTKTTVIGGAFDAPAGVTTDAVGNVLVADTANNEVKEIIKH